MFEFLALSGDERDDQFHGIAPGDGHRMLARGGKHGFDERGRVFAAVVADPAQHVATSRATKTGRARMFDRSSKTRVRVRTVQGKAHSSAGKICSSRDRSRLIARAFVGGPLTHRGFSSWLRVLPATPTRSRRQVRVKPCSCVLLAGGMASGRTSREDTGDRGVGLDGHFVAIIDVFPFVVEAVVSFQGADAVAGAARSSWRSSRCLGRA